MDTLLKLLGGFSVGGVTVGICAVQLVKHPELVEKWQAIIYGWLSHLHSGYKYISVKKDIQSRLNSFVNELSKDLGAPQTKVRVRWTANDEQEEVQIEDDGVIIVLRDRGYKNKNFVHAAYFYTSTTLLAHTKRHLSDKQGKSLDLYTTKKVIENQNRNALELFMRDYFQPLLEDEKIRRLVNKFVKIDKSGMYTHVLLQELSYLGTKSFLNKKDRAIMEEVNQLVDFLYTRAQREVGDTSKSEEFIGKYSRHSIKIVSTRAVRETGKHHIPAKRILKAFEAGIENVYVLGPLKDGGKEFIESACQYITGANQAIEVMKKCAFKNVVRLNREERIIDTFFVHLRNPAKAEYLIEDSMIDDLEAYSSIPEEEIAA